MPSRYSGCWELLYDWETLLTGLFALAAGGLAYCIGRRQVRDVVESQEPFPVEIGNQIDVADDGPGLAEKERWLFHRSSQIIFAGKAVALEMLDDAVDVRD